ncbi:MAG: hypothetical protein LBU70_02480 [Chitinispirillales bacterium]|jgi:hypothetical protein|nr:hypothetical protein [Chitinispirillales bacterium]
MKDKSKTFMGRYKPYVYASMMAVLLGIVMLQCSGAQKKKFDNTVREKHGAMGTDYDEQFIKMVANLEDMLAAQATFGFTGNKDPMTGTTRAVAAQQQEDIIRRGAELMARMSGGQATQAPRPSAAVDPVRLTAIIFDHTRNAHTAIITDGGRSLSVDVGDRVAGRRVTRVTSTEIHMESDTERFVYGIMGGSTRTPR